MKSFFAHHFDGRSTKRNPVTVTVSGRALTVSPADEGEEGRSFTVNLDEIRIDPDLAAGLRVIRLPEGMGHLETNETASVNALEHGLRKNRFTRALRYFETNLGLTVGMLVVTIGLLFALAYYAIPMLADRLALNLPPAAMDFITEKALGELDRGIFKPSEADGWRKRRLVDKYDAFAHALGIDPPRLIFRRLNGPPNAFALPARYIVVTDEMLDYVNSDDELLGVLAHETAHMEKKHALRQILQNSGVYLVLSLALGDATSILSVGAALPALLVESGYSRRFEAEADREGFIMMKKAGRPPEASITFLRRMEKDYPGAEGGSLLSSHPSLKARIQALERMK